MRSALGSRVSAIKVRLAPTWVVLRQQNPGRLAWSRVLHGGLGGSPLILFWLQRQPGAPPVPSSNSLASLSGSGPCLTRCSAGQAGRRIPLTASLLAHPRASRGTSSVGGGSWPLLEGFGGAKERLFGLAPPFCSAGDAAARHPPSHDHRAGNGGCSAPPACAAAGQDQRGAYSDPAAHAGNKHRVWRLGEDRWIPQQRRTPPHCCQEPWGHHYRPLSPLCRHALVKKLHQLRTSQPELAQMLLDQVSCGLCGVCSEQ